jgi:hypothetical protein
MNRTVILTEENINKIEAFVKYRIEILCKWKMMHILRRPEGSTGITEETAGAATITKPRKRKKIELTPQEFWEKEFLAHQTWRNLRITVRGFIEYAWCVLKTEREMNRTERKVWFVPMLHSNTTNLEGIFSVQRMRKCDNAQTYANGIARATANPKRAKTAARNSGQYEHNVKDQNTTPIIPELPSRDAGRKMKACEKQQTEWMTWIDVIVAALPKTTSRALQDGWLKMPRKSVLTGNIVQALRRQFQQKSYLGHLSSTETFVESSKLATVSTALRKCLESISKMSTSQAKQFKTVSELINIYVYKALTDHVNLAHKKNMHESFEMALYWSYLEMNKNDNLRRRTIDQIQRILKDVPANDHFLPLLWKGFAECQSKWVESFFRETALSKRNVLSDNKITDIPSEVQQIVGWAI